MNLIAANFLIIYSTTSQFCAYSFQVYEGDPLPQHICSDCENSVYLFYEKMQNFQLLENGWLEEVRLKSPDHLCLEIREKLDVSVHSASKWLIFY